MCECCSEHTDGRTERMLMSAIELEKEGLAFYAQASEQTHNELGKRIFRSLEKDEISHVRTIQAIYEALHHGEAWPSAAEPPAGQADLRAMIERFAADHQAGLHAASDDLSAIEAMKRSFRGCLGNILPFLIYGVVAFVLSIIAMIPIFLGLLFLVPTLICSTYIAYREIFLAQD